MTSTETYIHELGMIKEKYFSANDFDEQWILFKSFLNTFHSIYDTDNAAKKFIHKAELLSLGIIIRNIFHHQPKRLNFGQNEVAVSKFSLSTKKPPVVSLTLVIPRTWLTDPETQNQLLKIQRQRLQEILENDDSELFYCKVIIERVLECMQFYGQDFDKYHKELFEK